MLVLGPNLRKEGEKIAYTPAMVEEWKRCRDDIIYFAEKYCYVNNVDDGAIIVKLRDYQKELLTAYTVDEDPERRNRIVLSSRQSGKTETSSIFMLHYILFNRDKRVAILANDSSLSKQIVENIKWKYEKLPKFLQQGIKTVGGWSSGRIALDNNCEMRSGVTKPKAMRGFTANVLFLDEFALLDHTIEQAFMRSVMPIISSGKKTRIIISSCVVKDTMVFTPEGIKTVGDFVIDDGRVLGYEVPAYNVLGRYGMNHGHIMHNDGDERETRIITTSFSEVETSTRHKFWSCRDGVYAVRRAEDLAVGDYVMVKYGMNCWGDDRINYDDTNERMRFHFGKIDEITEDMAYLFGLYIAEGYAEVKNNRRLCITCGDDISWCFKRLGLEYHCYDGIHYGVASKAVCKLLQSVGFDVLLHAKEKIIPARLMRMSKRNVAAMLRGMFDGDGSADCKRKRVTYTSTSKRLIDQVRILLLNFGILSTVAHHITKPTKKVKVSSEVWAIEIARQSMVDLFFKEIGFELERKANMQFAQKRHSAKPSHYDYIPYSAVEVRRLRHNRVITKKVYDLKDVLCNAKSSHLNRKRILEIKSVLPEEVWSQYDCFKNAEPDCVWAQIKEIKKSKNKVYDFSLDDDNYGGYGDAEWAHSVVHNSFVCFQTPNGLNSFYNLWTDAVAGRNNFVPIKIDWTKVPGRDEKFKQQMISMLGMIGWRQEYECAFLGSSKLLVTPEAITKNGQPKQPIKELYGGKLKIYEEYHPGCSYVISADPAVGNGGDNSAIQVLRIDGKEKVAQVATYKDNNTPYDKFSAIVIEVAKMYGNPPMMVENNGVGQAVVNKLYYDYEYENMVHTAKKGIGVQTNRQVKLDACLLFQQYFENGWITLVDEDTIKELTMFEEVRDKIFRAISGAHDDLVMAVLLGLYYLSTPYFDEGSVSNPAMLGDGSAETGMFAGAEMEYGWHTTSEDFHRLW